MIGIALLKTFSCAKNLEEITAFYIILVEFYMSLFKELSQSPIKETERKLTGEKLKGLNRHNRWGYTA